ncbi:dolichol kinase [Halovivax limisalsi]|uniref:dolichol kinase n=1 Tax=Halovivax limisalsi TaxID=1453760 RepID=UPI001FFD4C75|nr:dolichol kinase [Halovivax limisalsi]
MADELKRRLVHASGSGLVALFLLARSLDIGLTWQRFRLLMVVLAAGTIGLEYLRLRGGLEWWLYDKLTREYEQDQFAGYGWYMVSMALVVLAFDWRIALPAMLMLSIGDPVSGWISADSLRRVKRPAVLAGMFAVCALLAIPFLYEYPLAAIAAALGATVADGVTVKRGDFVLDDNLTIPIYAGVLAWIAVEFVPV